MNSRATVTQNGPSRSETYSIQGFFGDFLFLPEISLMVRLRSCKVYLLGATG